VTVTSDDTTTRKTAARRNPEQRTRRTPAEVGSPPSTTALPASRRDGTGRDWLAAIITGFGIAALLFVAFQLLVTEAANERSQRELRSQLAGWLTQAQGLSDGAGTSSAFGGPAIADEGALPKVPALDGELTSDAATKLQDAGYRVTIVSEASEDVLPGLAIRTEPPAGSELDVDGEVTLVVARLGEGAPVGLIAIPRLDIDLIVVEGTSPARTMEGPGHLRGTPLPGQAGTSVLLGRRSTYGSPFSGIGQLTDGDDITMVTTQGAFVYRVDGEPRVVRSGEVDILEPEEGNRLLLVTADPQYQATDRLVVSAVLDGEPVAASSLLSSATSAGGDATTAAGAPAVELNVSELGRQGDGAAWALVLLWMQFLVVALLAARWLYRNWLKWPTWLVSTPVVLFVAVNLFTAVNLLFPSTL